MRTIKNEVQKTGLDPTRIDGLDDLFQAPRLSKPEMHLLLKPFFLLDRHADRFKPIEYVYSVVQNGKATVRGWSVQPHFKYGLPGAFDRDVCIALHEIVYENYLAKNLPVPFMMPIGTLTQFLERMGLSSDSGKNVSNLKDSLNRLKNTLIDAQETFFHNKKKRYISLRMTLLKGVVFTGEDDELGGKYQQSYVLFDETMLSNLNSGYVMVLDVDRLRTLKTNIAKQLYTHLAYRFFVEAKDGDSSWSADYKWLTVHLGIKPQKELWRAKQQLESAHKELQKLNYISNYLWDGWRVVYRPGSVWQGEQLRRQSGKAKHTSRLKPSPPIKLPNKKEPSVESIEPLHRALLLFATGLPKGLQRIKKHGLTQEEAINLCQEKNIPLHNQ